MPQHQWLFEWAQWLWPALFNHLWQASLFTLAALALAARLPRQAARWRQAVWLLAFAKFLLPAALLLALVDAVGVRPPQSPARQPRAESTRAQVIYQLAQPLASKPPTLPVSAAPNVQHHEWACLLTLAWLSGAAALLLRWGWRYRRFARSLRSTPPLEAARERAAFARVGARLGLRGRAELVVMPDDSAAGVFGLCRPLVVLPLGLANELDEEELEAVLAHELAHVRRRDNWRGAAQMLVCCLFWFHPLVWLLDRRLRAEREWLCDEAVLRAGHAPQLYAASLWKAAQFGWGWPANAPLAGNAPAAGADLKRRIEMLLQPAVLQSSTPRQRLAAGLAVTLLALLAVVIVPFARPAARAQSGQAPASVRVLPGVYKNGDNRRITEQLDLTPETPLQFKNRPGAPLIIQDVKLQAVKFTFELKPGETSTNCAWRLQLTLTNQSGRRVTGFAYEWATAPGAHGGLIENPYASLEPSTTLTFGKTSTSYGPCVVVSRDQQRAEISLAGVKFENEPHWGSFQSYAMGMPIRHTMEIYASGHPPAISAETRQIVRASEAGQSNEDDNTVYDLQNVDAAPLITYSERPAYPDEVQAQRITGLVLLSAVLRADGSVTGLRVERGLSGGLTEYAIESARKLRFQPATKNGQPVSVRMPLEYRFGK